MKDMKTYLKNFYIEWVESFHSRFWDYRHEVLNSIRHTKTYTSLGVSVKLNVLTFPSLEETRNHVTIAFSVAKERFAASFTFKFVNKHPLVSSTDEFMARLCKAAGEPNRLYVEIGEPRR